MPLPHKTRQSGPGILHTESKPPTDTAVTFLLCKKSASYNPCCTRNYNGFYNGSKAPSRLRSTQHAGLFLCIDQTSSLAPRRRRLLGGSTSKHHHSPRPTCHFSMARPDQPFASCVHILATVTVILMQDAEEFYKIPCLL